MIISSEAIYRFNTYLIKFIFISHRHRVKLFKKTHVELQKYTDSFKKTRANRTFTVRVMKMKEGEKKENIKFSDK